jgi:hypothetical protein
MVLWERHNRKQGMASIIAADDVAERGKGLADLAVKYLGGVGDPRRARNWK